MPEGLKLLRMSRGRIIRRLPFRHRIGAASALFALLFASLAVALPHAMAMPVQAPPVMAMQADPGHSHDHDHAAAHRHGPATPADASGNGASGSGTAPCDNGCVFCKDCALCSFATAAPPAALPVGDNFERFAPARVPQPADIDPARAIKPPRV